MKKALRALAERLKTEVRVKLQDSILRAELTPLPNYRWGDKKDVSWSVRRHQGGGYNVYEILTPFGSVEVLIPED